MAGGLHRVTSLSRYIPHTESRMQDPAHTEEEGLVTSSREVFNGHHQNVDGTTNSF